MIIKFTVKDYDGFCHDHKVTLQTVEDVAEKIFNILSDVSFVESVGVSKVLSENATDRLQFWGWFTYGDSFDSIYSKLIAL